MELNIQKQAIAQEKSNDDSPDTPATHTADSRSQKTEVLIHLIEGGHDKVYLLTVTTFEDADLPKMSFTKI